LSWHVSAVPHLRRIAEQADGGRSLSFETRKAAGMFTADRMCRRGEEYRAGVHGERLAEISKDNSSAKVNLRGWDAAKPIRILLTMRAREGPGGIDPEQGGAETGG
jgi:hypothetical protein